MAWVEAPERRTRTAKTWRRNGTSEFRYEHVAGTVLHFPTGGPDSDVFDAEVDLSPVRVDNAQLDGWRVVHGEWHYALGQPGDKATDGWVGFGGRQGAHWLQFRLLRVGYLHWPTRAWDDVGGPPSYDRANLSQKVDALTLGPEGAEVTVNAQTTATWADLWTTPGGGSASVAWRADGLCLKEEVTLNQVAREWIVANHPPSTPVMETWFGFVFQLDVSDIPQWVVDGVLQDPDGDFTDDDGLIEIRDALGRLLGFMPVSVAFSEEYGEEPAAPQRDIVRLRKRVWKDGDSYYLLVGARVDQLNGLHEGAITFDPTFNQQGADKDTYLLSTNGDKHFGGDDNLIEDGSTYVTLIYFDCSSIPSSATCSSATLYQYAKADKGAQTVPFHELLAANDGWVEGSTADPGYGKTVWDHHTEESSGGAADEVDWAGAAGCATSGTDYVATAMGTLSLPSGGLGTEGSASLTTSDVEDWFGVSNENYGIRGKRSSGAMQCITCSSEHATSTYRPKLVIVYIDDVYVSPAALTAVVTSVAPTTVLGSLTVSPAALTSVVASVAPSVVHGSVTVTPGVVTAVVDSVAPSVLEGDVIVTPSPVSAVAASTGPSVVLGSLSVSPTAIFAVTAGVDPTVVADVTVAPAAVTGVTATVAPSVVQDSMTVTPSVVTAVAASTISGVLVSGRTFYVDATTGDDADSGLTEELAWETVDKVADELAAGNLGAADQVLFKRGETFPLAGSEWFRVQGSSGTFRYPIYIGAYGTGARPIIEHGGTASLPVLGRYAGDDAANYFVFEDLELDGGFNTAQVDIAKCSYWTFRDCYFHGCKEDENIGIGVHVWEDSHHILFEDCESAYHEGEGWYIGDNDTTNKTRRVILRRCNAHDNYNEGIDIKFCVGVFVTGCTLEDNAPGGDYDYAQCNLGGRHLRVYNTRITGATDSNRWGLNFFYTYTYTGCRYVRVDRCLFDGCGGGSYAAVRFDGHNNRISNCTFVDTPGDALWFESTWPEMTNEQRVFNNVFEGTLGSYQVLCQSNADTRLYEFDNNCYGDGKANPWYWNGSARNIDYVQGTLGYEASAVEAAPSFAEETNFTLNVGSPCINAGDAAETVWDWNKEYGSSPTGGPDCGWQEYGWPRPHRVFESDFGTVDDFSAVSGVSLASAAAYLGTYGGSVSVTDTSSRYVSRTSLGDLDFLYTRVHVNPANLMMGTGDEFTLLQLRDGSDNVLGRVNVNYSGSVYRVRAGIMADDDSVSYTDYFTLLAGWNHVELWWCRSLYTELGNWGEIELMVNGSWVDHVTDVNNDTRQVDRVYLRL